MPESLEIGNKVQYFKDLRVQACLYQMTMKNSCRCLEGQVSNSGTYQCYQSKGKLVRRNIYWRKTTETGAVINLLVT